MVELKSIESLNLVDLCFLCAKNTTSLLFLDIETEGLSKEKNDITLIGVYTQGKYLPFIKGLNLERSLSLLKVSPIWVTFGGERFDLPFIKKRFPEVSMPVVHLDLYLASKLVGLNGGLKKIEKAIGIARETEGMNGYHAVKLWQRWVEAKDKNALRKLILYNKEDVVNLKKVFDYVVSKLAEQRKEGQKGGEIDEVRSSAIF
ncbi:ribonuclease H-like domain-containing protein [Thermodesulfobacterium thermophilum]|uniref:ribonuclease H-like domain-containing protein n=1 Tax=Thermodesulfobacterium thermophilum TaxID=886 RepID=UPI0003B60328|nr:ribonuclease H-like domain-containing protein [Thermodesulfobacterium thermophilum]